MTAIKTLTETFGTPGCRVNNMHVAEDALAITRQFPAESVGRIDQYARGNETLFRFTW